MKHIILVSLLAFCGCTSTETQLKTVNGTSETMKTKGYRLNIEHNCPAECVSCKKMKLILKSNKMKKEKNIFEGSIHPATAESIYSDNFKGYKFQDRLATYYVLENGLFQIVDPCGNVQVSEKWTYSQE